MNYRHAFHAGNQADVFKHYILTLLLKAMVQKPAPFMVLDTHAGIGCYDLNSIAAQKTKEYESGIAKLLKDNSGYFDDYLNIVSANGYGLYPGSPLIASHFLRDGDNLLLHELHEDDFITLKNLFRSNALVKVNHGDGYKALKTLQPRQKRGLVLIDPPFEQKDEFAAIVSALTPALKSFRNGIYAIWYPVKDVVSVAGFIDEIAAIPNRPETLVAEMMFYPDIAPSRLNGTGMVIINPPYKLQETLVQSLPTLLNALEMKGRYSVNQL